MKHVRLHKLDLSTIDSYYLGIILAAYQNKEGVLVEYPHYTGAHSARIKLIRLCAHLRSSELPPELKSAVNSVEWAVKDADGLSVGTRTITRFRAPFYLLGYRRPIATLSVIESALDDQMPNWRDQLQRALHPSTKPIPVKKNPFMHH